MKNRNFFFNTSGTDVFKTGDIPTQPTFAELFDSVPFFLELGDRAQLLRPGLMKTATDNAVNNRSNNEKTGGITMGSVTGVRPAQIPRVFASTNNALISVSTKKRVANSTQCDQDTGNCIDDYVIEFTGTLPEFTADIKLTAGKVIKEVTGTVPNLGIGTINVFTNTALETLLVNMVNALNQTTQSLYDLNEKYKNEVPEIGSLNETLAPPNTWTDVWLWCDGTEYNIADYPTLAALLGANFGAAASGKFRVPNYTDKFLRGANAGQVGVPFTAGGANQQSITLTINNLPTHNHTFSSTTDADGQHSHSIKTYDNDVTGGGFPEAVNNTGTPNFAATELAGTHTHNFSGTTDNQGNSTPFAVQTVPAFYPVYIRIKAK